MTEQQRAEIAAARIRAFDRKQQLVREYNARRAAEKAAKRAEEVARKASEERQAKQARLQQLRREEQAQARRWLEARGGETSRNVLGILLAREVKAVENEERLAAAWLEHRVEQAIPDIPFWQMEEFEGIAR